METFKGYLEILAPLLFHSEMPSLSFHDNIFLHSCDSPNRRIVRAIGAAFLLQKQKEETDGQTWALNAPY